MNIHTFKDAVTSKRQALANEVEEDEDEEDVGKFVDDLDGEEDDGEEKFNDVGEVLEPFNLKDEREGGHFDANLNYVWKKETGEVDSWVAGMDEATMEKAIGEAATALKRKRALQDEQDAKDALEGPANLPQLRKEALGYMRPGETILKTLRRLGHKASRRAKSRASGLTSLLTAEEKAALNRLTEIAEILMSNGDLDVYETSYEALQTADTLWEYRAPDGSIQGPFTSQQMAQWKKAGYFIGDSAVPMRRVQTSSTQKRQRIEDELADDFSDDESQPVNSSSAGYDAWISSDDIDFGIATEADELAQPEDEEQADDNSDAEEATPVDSDEDA